ncbi:RagB/SusD family nutrient uptake outer membrane protein [Bacteroides sp. 519]|uniref:RagB/SusD family nutrient uptake outer membrane protein n=1 Tax=Bacteroides sp. 519 TaxID=2302937 RepID=UPI0013D27563|nr:RagB/SusD family nutrient uptake outer membrane protein [Bacteroides sp. 519]NDV59130.1 RagB/SusD family nutrient uptake outer membrane protein [Bacteroides sp. 519]
MNAISKKINILVLSIIGILFLSACESWLDEPVRSQFGEENLLSTKQGLESVLADAYAKNCGGGLLRDIVKREEFTTDILWQTGGGENGTAVPLINFRWDPSNAMEALDWMPYWRIIRNCNIVMDNLPNVKDINTEKERAELHAEAQFMRIWAYYQLWDQFGPMPIRKTQSEPLELPKASTEDFATFMETELLETIKNLPTPGKEPDYGRVHSGGAKALLCLWYLNNRQWQKCADMAQDIISGKQFDLYPDYTDLFALENEQNCEFILVKTTLANSGTHNVLLPTALPWDFKVGIDGGLNGVVNEKWSNFASQYRMYDEFYYSFDAKDERKSRIVTKYQDSKGVIVDLLVDYKDATRGIKYPPDPAASGESHGNDFPIIRYAEILLARAEALNQLNGPNQESMDLINKIRKRAGVDELDLKDYPTKESMIEQILKERRWEFWYEGKRRRDLIRNGMFIECAHNRGIENADEHHLWFPIPQSAIDANSLLEQNKDY